MRANTILGATMLPGGVQQRCLGERGQSYERLGDRRSRPEQGCRLRFDSGQGRRPTGSAARTHRAELLALRWSHVDLDASVLTVRRNYLRVNQRSIDKGTKTHQMRRLAIDPATPSGHRRAGRQARGCGPASPMSTQRRRITPGTATS
jgi:integrase